MLANVLVDIEVLYYLSRGNRRVHGFLHTYIGGFAMGLLAGFGMYVGFWMMSRLIAVDSRWRRSLAISRPRRDLFDSLFAGLIGGASHILLDSLMHRDMHPFWPIVEGNAVAGAVSTGALHVVLAATGFLGVALMALLFDRNSPES